MLVSRSCGILLCSTLALAAAPGLSAQANSGVIDIGSRREMFVDDYVVDRLAGKALLRLHEPVAREVVMVFDRPWEGNTSVYHSIFRDGKILRMYYRGSHNPLGGARAGRVGQDGELPSTVCYAESEDGLTWRRPDVGLFKFDGWEGNNVVFVGGEFGGFPEVSPDASVIKDENPKAAPDARYKMLVWSNKPKMPLALKSADGLRWSLLTDNGGGMKMGAAQNGAFWDVERNQYRAYWRTNVFRNRPYFNGFRAIATSVSDDFLNWTKMEDLIYAEPPVIGTVTNDYLAALKTEGKSVETAPIEEHLYTQWIKPYPRAPHIFIGLPVRYVERPWSDSLRALPDRDLREQRTAVEERLGTALTESILMASHDGLRFKRWDEAFLRPGPQRRGTWNYGQQYLAWGFVETKSNLPGADNELSFYASEDYSVGQGSSLRRYTLRLDGFVSAHAPLSGGELITKPFRFKGAHLSLNFATSAVGSVRVEIQDPSGNPLPGFSLEECPPVFGDTSERTVTWAKGSDASALAGQPVRLRFVLRDADVYSFQFRN